MVTTLLAVAVEVGNRLRFALAAREIKRRDGQGSCVCFEEKSGNHR